MLATSPFIEHWFWALLTAACVVWYSTITIYVSIRGWYDIKTMLRKLGPSRPADAG